MIKLVCFVKRMAGMDAEAFHDHWEHSHGPLIAGTPELARHIRRYEQHSRIEARAASGGFDGVTIQWFDSMRDFAAFAAEPAYAAKIAPDEARFLDRGGFGLIFTEDSRPIVEGPKEQAGAKLLCLLRRAPGMEPEAFHRHWSQVHGPLLRDLPDLTRHVLAYDQSSRLAKDYAREAGGGWDGLAEVWFEGPDAVRAMTAEPAYHEHVVPDEDRLIDRGALEAIVTGPARVVIA